MFQNTEKDIITKKTKKNLHKEAYLLKKKHQKRQRRYTKYINDGIK